ncbi:hypothetical protein ABW19_dt0204680 [Dactylella cylindrospora]|nr:hypothetical protein ABW19_dt0204680 [Dactylella cylindrospora]
MLAEQKELQVTLSSVRPNYKMCRESTKTKDRQINPINLSIVKKEPFLYNHKMDPRYLGSRRQDSTSRGGRGQEGDDEEFEGYWSPTYDQQNQDIRYTGRLASTRTPLTEKLTTIGGA